MTKNGGHFGKHIEDRRTEFERSQERRFIGGLEEM